MPDFELTGIDLAIIGLYAVVMVGVGFWAGRGTKDFEDYFLAGRGMIRPLVGFSLIVTNFSGSQFLGLAGAVRVREAMASSWQTCPCQRSIPSLPNTCR